MKEFKKWWKKYTSDGICDYEECYEAGWKAALEWALSTRQTPRSVAILVEHIIEELEGE